MRHSIRTQCALSKIAPLAKASTSIALDERTSTVDANYLRRTDAPQIHLTSCTHVHRKHIALNAHASALDTTHWTHSYAPQMYGTRRARVHLRYVALHKLTCIVVASHSIHAREL